MSNEKSGAGLIQFVKFAIVGFANTGVDWAVYYVLTEAFSFDDKILSKAISFTVAVLNSYFWNTIWTFKNEYKKAAGDKSNRSAKYAIFAKFIVVSIIGLAINYYTFSWVIGRYNPDLLVLGKTISDLMPLICASAAAIIWNFFANKLWTYKK